MLIYYLECEAWFTTKKHVVGLWPVGAKGAIRWEPMRHGPPKK